MVAALISMSAPAMASKARSSALGGSHTVATDVQYIFENPQKMWDLGDLATFEFGGTGTTYALGTGAATASASTTANAEGGFLRSSGSSKWGAYVGHQSSGYMYMTTVTTNLGVAVGQHLQRMENPLNVFYGFKAGDMNVGFNAYYASSEHKTGTTTAEHNKKSAMGVAAGMGNDKWNAGLVLGLAAKAEETEGTNPEVFKAGMNAKLAAEFALNEEMVAFGSVTNLAGKHNATGSATDDLDFEALQLEVGVESKVKSDMVHFFYGAAIQNSTAKNKVTGASLEKVEKMIMPVYFGLEADAASWLVLRSSLKQNVLLASTKFSSTTTTSDGSNSDDSTEATVGAGLKFGKLMFDGTLSAQTAGKLSATDVLTNASLTYMF